MKKKLLLFMALLCACVSGAWADTQVIARMNALVGAATSNNAKVNLNWRASEGDVYQFDGTKQFIGGITNANVLAAIEGDQYVTVAMYVYGKPSGCPFGYGDNDDGLKFMFTNASNATVKLTTKSVKDFDSNNLGSMNEADWNLVAFTVPGKALTSATQSRYISPAGIYSVNQTLNTGNSDNGMKTPANNSKKFAIGSGNQGNWREGFNGLIANVTVITSSEYLDYDGVKAQMAAAPTDNSANVLTLTYNIRATNSGNNPISWTETKEISKDVTTEASTTHLTTYNYISDYAITNADLTLSDENKTFNVTATHNLPMVPGKYYELHYTENVAWYLSYVDDSNVSMKAAANSGNPNNVWYVKQASENAPYFSLCNLSNDKAVHGKNASNNACEFVDAFAYEFAPVNATTFRLFEPGTNYNLGAHGNYLGANGGIGRWDTGNRNGGTIYEAIEVIVKSSDTNANYYQIKCNGNENYLNPFTFPTSEESERGIFQFYASTTSGKYYIYEAGSQKWLKYSDTNDGTKKISLADSKSDASLFVVNYNGSSTDIFNISPASKTTTSLNWHGGVGRDPYRKGTDSAMNGIGFYNDLNDGNSKWKIFAVTENVEDAVDNSANTYTTLLKEKYTATLAEAKNYVSHIGDGLNQYSTTVDKTTFTAAITALETAFNEEGDVLAAGATLQEYVDNLQINQPTNGSFIRIRNAGGSNKRMSCVNQSNGRPAFANDLNIDKIFYYDGTYLRAYKTGMYVGIASNFLTNCTDPDANNGTTFTFSASPVNIGTYNVIFNGDRYLHDDGNAGSNAANSSDTKYTFWLEEVPNMYAVTINDADAYVQTADEVQVKNGGYLYVANGTAEVTASDKAGYIKTITKNENPNTITVTYTNVNNISGYYFIKNASDQYATNDFTTTTFGDKVDAYNGMWKAAYDEDENTLTINNGVGTPLYVGGNPYSELTLTGGVNGAFTAKSEDDAVWTLEPVALGARLISNVTIVGDNGEGWLKFNHNSNDERAKDGGFFLINTSNDFDSEYRNLTWSEIQDKDASINVNGHNDIALGYANQADITALEQKIRDVYPHLNTIGYPKYPGNKDLVAEESMSDLSYVASGYSIAPRLYAEFVQDLNAIYSATDVVLPTEGAFYTLTNYNGESKTYYFTENSELLSYDNGLFTKIGVNAEGAFVDYAGVGTTTGETFEFSKSTAGFGKLAAWQLGEGPLPSGDGRINSGWTITRQPAPAIKMNSVNGSPYYTTLYMPTPVIMPEGVTAYSATANGTELELATVALPGQTLAANTPVILSGEAAKDAITVATDATGAKTASSNVLEGTITTMPQDPAYKYYVLSGEGGKVGFYKYKASKNLNGFKVYYKVDAPADPAQEVKGFTFTFSDIETAIKAIEKENNGLEIYDMNGRRVQKATKGLYIVNGKKVMYK